MSKNDDTNTNQKDIVIVSGPDAGHFPNAALSHNETPITIVVGNDDATLDLETEYMRPSFHAMIDVETEYMHPSSFSVLDIDADYINKVQEGFLRHQLGYRLRIERGENVDFKLSPIEGTPREGRNFNRNSQIQFASVTAPSNKKHSNDPNYEWTQKTQYVEPEPDHKAHWNAAEEKRKRKAEKLKKLSANNQKKDD